MEILFKRTLIKGCKAYVNNLVRSASKIEKIADFKEESVTDSEYENTDKVFESTYTNASLILYYPLRVVVREFISFSTLQELIDQIRSAYSTILEGSTIYGFWKSKDIKDLYIDGIKIYTIDDSIYAVPSVYADDKDNSSNN